jgi:hypothetical protein
MSDFLDAGRHFASPQILAVWCRKRVFQQPTPGFDSYPSLAIFRS